jgi:hypothetical protein
MSIAWMVVAQKQFAAAAVLLMPCMCLQSTRTAALACAPTATTATAASAAALTAALLLHRQMQLAFSAL